MTLAVTLAVACARRGRKICSDWRAREDGVSSVEFALLGLPAVALLLAIFQIGLVFLAQGELETAVERASRQLLTGQAQQDGATQSQFIATLCSYLPALFTCSGVMVDLQTASAFSGANTATPTLTYDSNGNVANSFSFQTGSAGSILVLRVFYQFPVFAGPMSLNLANLANGTRLLLATAVFQVEPYGTSGG